MSNVASKQSLGTIGVSPQANNDFRKQVSTFSKYAFLIVLTILWLVPMIAAVITSLRTMADINANGFWSIPAEISFGNFERAWNQANVSAYLGNSFLITIPSLFFMLLLSSLSSFALARYKFRWNLPLYFMFVAGTMLPFQILLLPVFRLANSLGLYDTHWALIIIHTAFQMGFCTFVLRNFMKGVPSEIFEAAKVDGASEFRQYWQMMLPLSLPSMAALATLEFTWVFNDYLWALVLIRSDSLKPVTAGLSTLQGQFVSDWTLITAGAILATLPTIFVFVFLQRYFIQGLTLGSNK